MARRASRIITLIAAGVAFYAMLALFPAMIVVVSVYGLVMDPEELSGAGFLQGLAGEAGGDRVGEVGAGGDVVVGTVQRVGEGFLGGLGLGDLFVEVGELALGECAPAVGGLWS
jgi:hypothetical protein